MARVAGVNLPLQKHVWVGLTSIFGVGKSRALFICDKAGIEPSTKVKDLTESAVKSIQDIVATYRVEGDLRREIGMNIKRYVDLRCYKGIRHKMGLPVHGQRTKTNARTRKSRGRSTQRVAVSKAS